MRRLHKASLTLRRDSASEELGISAVRMRTSTNAPWTDVTSQRENVKGVEMISDGR